MRALAAALVGVLSACSAGLPIEPPGPDVERCTDTDARVSCLRQELGLKTRKVHWQIPAGEAPATGWPAVITFHGSFTGTGPHWEAKDGDKWGAYRAAQTTKALLERGYAVLTPESIHGGAWYWNSNVVGYAENWGIAPDHEMMVELLALMKEGKPAPFDLSRLYATGISSGGYMTSRMAISYEGQFKALAVHSASFAKCGGSICSVPELPATHPPTLLLHGEQDSIVPVSTMRAYEAQLTAQGLEVSAQVSATAGHEWLEAAVSRVPDWFDAHR
ncbi:MAG: hypothetical protein JNK82_39555 [Myxococcaceae bacterium]|nr:hypothetical protein [Myxococcaceae bacterium]